MPIHPEDPRLTAYAAGELGAAEAAEVERAVAADPALQAELAEIQATVSIARETLTLPRAVLLAGQKEEILRLARKSDLGQGTAPAIPWFSKMQGWLIPAAAAAVLAIATFILTRMPDDRPKVTTTSPAKQQAPVGPTDVAKAPAPAPVAPPYVSPNRGPLAPSRVSRLDLPIRKEKTGLDAITRPIRDDQRLPSRDLVHLEELLNNFTLRFNGTTAIARGAAANWHPDKRPAGTPPVIATLSTEMVACPWKPSATLLLVSVRGNAHQDTPVSLSYVPDPAKVARYRLLGYSGPQGGAGQKIPDLLPAGASTVFAIEIEPTGPQTQFGSLEWTTHGEKAPSIQLTHNRETEPSDDARFATLLCTYGQWLAGEQAGIIDAEIVSGLARELDSATLAPERVEFLALVNRSLHF